MTIHLSTADKRDLDALVYFANADRWQKKITLKDGRRCYAIPSRSRAGLFHLTDGSDCSCEDERNNRPVGGCAHRRAAALYRMGRVGEATKGQPKAKRALCRVCTNTLPTGVLSGVCSQCEDAGLMFEGVAAIKAAFGSQRDAVVQTIG